MSRTTLPSKLTPAAAHELAADFLAARRAWAGGLELTMTAPTPPTPTPATPPAPAPEPAGPERPEGISEAEWAALGDPGKAALTREREARRAAEQALAAHRSAPPPAPPKAPTPPAPPPTGPDGQLDIAAMIERAVSAAVTPLHEAQAQRDADAAALVIRDAVTAAAGVRMHDANDALTQIDLTTVTDGNGRPDPAKITAALDALLQAKPYLGRVNDPRRRAPADALVGGTPGFVPSLDDRTKASLARMQAAAGVAFADPAKP